MTISFFEKHHNIIIFIYFMHNSTAFLSFDARVKHIIAQFSVFFKTWGGKSVWAKRNIIDAKHHIIAKHIICTKCNLVHLCPPCGGMMLNWRSNDVACKHANDVVSCGHKWKNPSRATWIFWQGQKDLNPRPMVLETSTLPTELYPCVSLLATDILYHRVSCFAILFSKNICIRGSWMLGRCVFLWLFQAEVKQVNVTLL